MFDINKLDFLNCVMLQDVCHTRYIPDTKHKHNPIEIHKKL